MNPGPNQQSTTNTQPVIGSFDNSGNVIQLYGPNSVPLTLNGIDGVTDGSDAGVGNVGEYQSSTLVAGSAISLSTGVAANITSLSLTAGDWDVSGVVAYHSASGTTVPADVLQGIGTVSATVPALGAFSYDYIGIALSATDDPVYPSPVVRISISATTTVYLVAKSDFSVSTLTAYGFMRARRVR